MNGSHFWILDAFLHLWVMLSDVSLFCPSADFCGSCWSITANSIPKLLLQVTWCIYVCMRMYDAPLCNADQSQTLSFTRNTLTLSVKVKQGFSFVYLTLFISLIDLSPLSLYYLFSIFFIFYLFFFFYLSLIIKIW